MYELLTRYVSYATMDFHVFIYLFIYVFISICYYLLIYLCIGLFIYPSPYLMMYLCNSVDIVFLQDQSVLLGVLYICVYILHVQYL